MRRFTRNLNSWFISRTRNNAGMSRSFLRSAGIAVVACVAVLVTGALAPSASFQLPGGGVLGTVGALAPTVTDAFAFDPANFGFSAVNDGDGPLQEAPAIPPVDGHHAFWAGTCDRAVAPPSPPPPFVSLPGWA